MATIIYRRCTPRDHLSQNWFATRLSQNSLIEYCTETNSRFSHAAFISGEDINCSMHYFPYFFFHKNEKIHKQIKDFSGFFDYLVVGSRMVLLSGHGCECVSVF